MKGKSNFLKRLKNKFSWEFWPTYMFYIPLFPLYLFYSLKSRSLTYFVAANPAIKNGGDATESKFDTLKILPKNLIPKSVFVPEVRSLEKIRTDLKQQDLAYPLIIKPNIGYRGLLVKKLKNETNLSEYLIKYTGIAFIIQEFIDYKNECGVLYVRYPNQKTGEITSITIKNYLHVTGDGTSSLAQLIDKNEHVKRYKPIFKDLITKIELNTTPKKDEAFVLNEIGNHCKGASFINGNHLISEKLTHTFDKLSHSIKGVYFGRFDIKYNSFKELEEGKSFKIIELNGVISEPTHIYDAANSSFYIALKSIAKHWQYVYQISKMNHQKYGIDYAHIIPELKELFALRPYNKNIKKLSEL